MSITESIQTNAPRPWVAWVYLTLSVAGAILPWMANLEFMRQHGAAFDLGLFVRLANANPAAQSLSRDLLVGSSAVLLWMVVEARRLGIRGLWLALLCTVTIAFACGAPLFLFLRERRLQELSLLSGGPAPFEPPHQS
ncbi:DUF2834 domain-containing protein [Cyanobium sp. Morenito 9A2]|uniref:DUF2834 domain-containing protein n=1 Tax=Cyanobium sp. Morenito 9A2 TaxID=2823718 RepID=UPI0020CE60B6|nr:DUF2834 domain-containing protein [Cyanobium sp. Morenito 9A2]MCP9849883.1 DUF2834 domain-containing protein [Cyanobium sp. Morenito 9A2]